MLRKPQIHTQSSRIAQPNPGHPWQQTHDRLRKRSSSAINRNEATTDCARKAVRPYAAKSHERSHSKAAHPSAATKHNRSRSRAHALRHCRQRWLTIVGSLPRMAELLCERYRSWVCCRGWPRFGCAMIACESEACAAKSADPRFACAILGLLRKARIRGLHSKIRGSEVCMSDPRIIAQSSDPRFAQQNPRMVRIRTLRLTYICVYMYYIHCIPHTVCRASSSIGDPDAWRRMRYHQ